MSVVAAAQQYPACTCVFCQGNNENQFNPPTHGYDGVICYHPLEPIVSVEGCIGEDDSPTACVDIRHVYTPPPELPPIAEVDEEFLTSLEEAKRVRGDEEWGSDSFLATKRMCLD